MIVIPAIDLYEGKVVRLHKGDFGRKKEYPVQPQEVACRLGEKGFDYLQVIDLEGAQKGKPVHLYLLEKLSSCGIKIIYGGGLRSVDYIRSAFDSGAFNVYTGSLIAGDFYKGETLFKEWGNSIIPAFDIKDGKIAIYGWKERIGKEPVSFFRNFKKIGYKRFLVTSVLRDGTASGPDIQMYEELINEFNDLDFIAAGGIRNINDIKDLAKTGCWGAVTGRSFLENTIDIDEAGRVAKKYA